MIRVLLVEDDPALARATARSLASSVKIVGVVVTVVDALTQMQSMPPDVVVTDLDLGGGSDAPDGLDLALIIRASWPACAVILVSGSLSEDALRRAKQLGVSACFEKPFDVATLTAAIYRAVRQPHE